MPGFFIARMVCAPTARYTCPLNAGFLLPKNSELQKLKNTIIKRQAAGNRHRARQRHNIIRYEVVGEHRTVVYNTQTPNN